VVGNICEANRANRVAVSRLQASNSATVGDEQNRKPNNSVNPTTK
jgi:hypothetical protein